MRIAIALLLTCCFTIIIVADEASSSPSRIVTQIRIDAQRLIVATTMYCDPADSTRLRDLRITHGDAVLKDTIIQALSAIGYNTTCSAEMYPENPLSDDPMKFIIATTIHDNALFAKDIGIVKYPLFLPLFIQHGLLSSGTEQITLQCPEGYEPVQPTVMHHEHNSNITITFTDTTLLVFVASDKNTVHPDINPPPLFLRKKEVSQ